MKRLALKTRATLSCNPEVNPKLIVTRSLTFSRASHQLHVFASSFDWFTGLPASFVLEQSDYLRFGFMTLNIVENRSIEYRYW